jgi:uncharacterized membrane protein
MHSLIPRHDLHPVNVRHLGGRTTGERVADSVTARAGSWPFIVTQSTVLAIWIVYNAYVAGRLLSGKPFDPYPFIFLNLALSFQAAYTGPMVMMSQNRQNAKDRDMAEHDDELNQRGLELLSWQNDQLLKVMEALDVHPTTSPPGSPSGGQVPPS